MHHDKLTETALLIMEKVVKNELEEELPEDLRLVSLFSWSGISGRVVVGIIGGEPVGTLPLVNLIIALIIG